jgi:hypothetical protein
MRSARSAIFSTIASSARSSSGSPAAILTAVSFATRVPARVADRELRRAAADVDVERERRRGIARERDRAGAVRGEKALEVMSSCRADELPGLAAEELHDRGRVLLTRRLAGGDDRSGVHVVGLPARLGVRALDELAERVGVDAALR